MKLLSSLLFLGVFAPLREPLFLLNPVGRVPLLTRISSLCILALALAGCTSAGTPSLKMPANAIIARLDSLAAISHGDYIHLQVGPCLGHCEAYISIFRESPAKFHIYEAEAWRYNEFDRDNILYRLRRPITSDIAENTFRRLADLGLFEFVDDNTQAEPDHPTIWLRAGIGGRTLALDNVNLGGTKYAGAGKEQGLYKVYTGIRMLLLAELYGTRTEGTNGR